MKNKNVLLLLALFAFASSIFMTGCKKDDEKPSTRAMIVGIWKAESSRDVSYENGKVTDDETTPGNAGETYEFKSDGKVVYKESSSSTAEDGTWTLTDGDKKLILSSSSFPIALPFEIKEVSSTKLVLFMTYQTSSGGTTYKEESTLTFKK